VDQVSVIISPRNRVAQLYPLALSSLISAFSLVGRTSQRSFGSDLWDTIATFLESNILKVTVREVSQDSYPTPVTTVRMTEGSDNSTSFEVGLELPQGSDETDVAEGRGEFRT
jgi:hypothetical protein